MSVTAAILVGVGLVVFFALGFWVSSHLRRSRAGHAQEVLPSGAPSAILDGPSWSSDGQFGPGTLGVGSQAGIQVMLERLPSESTLSMGRSSLTLSSSSRVAAEVGRLATLAGTTKAGGKDLYRVAVNGRTLMRARCGGYRGNFVDPSTRRVTGGAVLDPAVGRANMAAVLGPQVVWAVAAVAVGQHFEAEIAKRLEGMERKLDHVVGEIDRERLAGLDAASRECERMALRLIDGVNPGEAVIGLSAQKQAIETNWVLSVDSIASAEKKLSELRCEGCLTATRLAGMWEDLFGEEARFSKDVRLFLSALSAKMRLIALLAADDAASAKDGNSAAAYRARLSEEMQECHEALGRLRSLAHDIVRLEYSLDVSEWTPLNLLQKEKSRKGNRLQATMRTVLQLEDELELLHLPFGDADIFPEYDLLMLPNPDGSLELGLERVMVPVEVDIA